MTVSTLRPDGTISTVGSPATVGAASAHAALSDNSDSSYVHSPTTGDIVAVSFDDLALPSGAVIKSLVPRARIANSASVAALNYQIGLNFAGTMLPFSYRFLATATWGSATTVQLSPFPAGGGSTLPTPPGSDADIDSVAVSLNLSGDGASNEGRIYELYLDVTYVEQPTLTVDAPVDARTVTDTNTPPVSWTETLDSDGGARTGYQVRIFDSATFGAGGFDPSTATPFEDSGVVTDSLYPWQPSLVQPDDTYRAYVRVQQTVNGSAFWSDWAFSEYTIDVAVPADPTLTLTPDD